MEMWEFTVAETPREECVSFLREIVFGKAYFQNDDGGVLPLPGASSPPKTHAAWRSVVRWIGKLSIHFRFPKKFSTGKDKSQSKKRKRKLFQRNFFSIVGLQISK